LTAGNLRRTTSLTTNHIDKRKALKNEKNIFSGLLSALFRRWNVQGRTASKAKGWV